MSKASRRSLVLASVALVAIPAAVLASHSWGGYHWARTSNPFTLKLGDNVSSGWDGYLATTASDWSQSQVLNTNVVAGAAKGRCRPTAGRVEVCNDTYGQNGWLGLAQIWLSRGHISQGAVKVNDTYFNMPKYNTVDEKNHVMCQEVGHTLGLTHTSEDGSSQGTCMDYSTSPNSTHPNQHDYQQLESIYAHLDSTTTVGLVATRMPPAMSQIDFATRAQWGTLVRKEGRSETYMLDFGRGHRILTFVYLAE